MRHWQRCHRLDDVAHVGELRKSFRREKRADLEIPHACGVFLAEPALLRRGRRKRLRQLQAIAQADLAQTHSVGRIDVLNAGHASLTAVLPVGEKPLPSGNSWPLSSVRTASVSAPSAGTFSP